MTLQCGVWGGAMGKGSLSAQALNRKTGGRLGCLHERVEADRGFWWGAGGQSQMGENLGHHRGIFDGCQERQGPATLRTGGHIDFKHAFE